jgi:hypothetical protein
MQRWIWNERGPLAPGRKVMNGIVELANAILAGAFPPFLTPFNGPRFGDFAGFRPSFRDFAGFRPSFRDFADSQPSFGFGRALNRAWDRWWDD